MRLLLSATQGSMFCSHSQLCGYFFTFLFLLEEQKNGNHKQSHILLRPAHHSSQFPDEEWSRKALRYYKAVTNNQNVKVYSSFPSKFATQSIIILIFLNNLCVHFSLETARGENVSSFTEMFYALLQTVASTICCWRECAERKAEGKSSGVYVRQTTRLDHVSAEIKTCGERNLEVSKSKIY